MGTSLRFLLLGLLVLLALWWLVAAPPAHIVVTENLQFDPATAEAMAAVDQSEAFAASLEHFPSAISGQDDVVFLHEERTALVSAMDGWIWKLDLATHAAERYVQAPLMPAGMHEAADGVVYFCSSYLQGESYPAHERVGLYRLDLATREISPVVLRVPATEIDHDNPVVYADDDVTAPTLMPDESGGRALAFCNDLELSADERRIYFTEPFAYAGASMGGGAIAEAVSLGGNGRLWRHDLDTGATRLIAEGFHFIDGVLYDLHPGLPRELSVLVSQTPMFRLTRFWLAGKKAGNAEIVLDSIPGMPDGLDRDTAGRIWTGLLKERSGLLTWLHGHRWIKPLFLRLPLEYVPQSCRTGVLVLTPDGSAPLYAASYAGPAVSNIASALPGPEGVYLSYFDRGQTGMLRLPYPPALR